MPIVDLDQQRAFALIAEITSTRNLLAYGVRVVRTGAFIDTTRDPILTMLSIGVEKLYKLTLGLAALDRDRSWPTKAQMKVKGHNLADMHEAVIAELHVRTADKSDYVRGLLDEVQGDPVIPPLIAALDMYGRMGRFYHLDLLGDDAQQWESPDGYWQEIETAALIEPELAATYAAAIAEVSNNQAWDRFYTSLNERIALAIERLWIMIAVSGRNHALGETGGAFGFEVHPDAVGRQ
ncbi:hypothetical protein [Arthrobacter sp. TB 23]|uniref:hypothetical protein n=1 Tax=Arthrobacter sp. TB 23 TaxID=494419 RepID=UPI0002E5C652|nr:hypothetical protein [Arthrobacter sp. TB 23]